MANNSPIASDLSYFVFQKRRERGELQPCVFNGLGQSGQAVLGYKASRLVTEPEIEDAGDGAHSNPPTVAAVGLTDEEGN